MRTFFNFKNADSPDNAEINLLDEIGFWGDNAKSFHSQLKAIKATTIKVHINSPGGSVVDGYAIYNMLRAHDADIEVHIDGMAASIASVIAMAGDKIIMPENALMFVHQPWCTIAGNSEELRKCASDMDKIGEGIKNIYMARTKMDGPTIDRLMSDETLLTAKEAKRLGFCDEIVPELKMAAAFKSADYFGANTVLRIAAHMKQFPSDTPSGGQENQPTNTMTPEEKAQLDAANGRVAALEAEKQITAVAVTAAKKEAHQDATTTVKAAEKTRKDGIQALVTKYGKDGDLNDVAVKAMAAETTVAEFQQQVMDLINERPAKAAIKHTGGEKHAAGSFGEKYEACKTDAERHALVRANKTEARAYLRSANIANS